MIDKNFLVTADNCSKPGAAIEKDGIHFGYYAEGKDVPSLLLYEKGSKVPATEIPFPESALPGRFYSMKVKLPAMKYEYNFREGDLIITDPYARKIAGREQFGIEPSEDPHEIRGGFSASAYDWGDDRFPSIPYEECIMYHLHVRGFTKEEHSGVRKKGTFAGLQEKIPYLQELGINQVKLMPVYDFHEKISLMTRPDGTAPISSRAYTGQNGMERYRLNYWGYGAGFYFAPKASYAYTKDPIKEFKDMVKAFHAAGIEVILEMYFGPEQDLFTIAECLTFWINEYHVDGFAVMARGSVFDELSRLPLFRSCKLICNWYPEEIKDRNAKRTDSMLLAESNDGFMNDCRRILKGEAEFLPAFRWRLREHSKGSAIIHYMTNHDGFTLNDLVTYDRKYNNDNFEQGRDGTDCNYSWNCGIEGPTKKREINRLRMQQRKNAFAMLLFSQGIPMLLAGDEIGNTQNGNNNPYCHDNELTWIDWSKKRINKELSDFVRQAVAYRRAHGVFHQREGIRCSDYRSCGYPDLSFHGERAWYSGEERQSKHVGCLYTGSYGGEKGFFYVAYNFDWEEREFALPLLPRQHVWYKVMDTSRKESFISRQEQNKMEETKVFHVAPRTIVILEGREDESEQYV